jgi:hypothetical protein
MSEDTALAKARQLVNEGNEEEAAKLLWPLCASKDGLTALNAIFVLLDALNPITENDKLLSLAERGIETASHLGQSDAKARCAS